MSPWLAFGAGLAAPSALLAAALAWAMATERTKWECRQCRWSSGWRGALPAWTRWRWHRHVTRRIGRCPR